MMLRYSLFSGLASAFVTLAGSTLCVNAQDMPQASLDPIVIIGSSVISEEEVERIAAGRPQAYADLPVDERRARITDTLLAEYVIDYYYGRDTQQLSTQVLDALNDARRQVLLQFFAQSQFTPPEITEADVADFAERNPQLFGDRRSYNFALVTLSGGTVDARQAAQSQLQDMLEQPEIDIAMLDKMVSSLQGDGVVATLNTAWQTSEALGDDVLSRLDAMVRNNQRINISQQSDAISILLLNSAVPIPADPTMLRAQIEQRLIAEAFNTYREELIRRTAQTVLNPPKAAVEARTEGAVPTVAPPPRGSVVWSSRPTLPRSVRLAALFGVGAFGTLAFSALLIWLRLTLRQNRQLLLWHGTAPLRKSRSFIITIALSGAVALIIGAIAVTQASLASFGAKTTVFITSGAIAASLAIVVLWRWWSLHALNRQVEDEGDKYEDSETARKMLALKKNPAKSFATAIGFSVLYSIAIVLVLDGPLAG